jgi:hypothetical protein
MGQVAVEAQRRMARRRLGWLKQPVHSFRQVRQQLEGLAIQARRAMAVPELRQAAVVLGSEELAHHREWEQLAERVRPGG